VRAVPACFDTAQSDLGVAALDGLIDGGKCNIDKGGFALKAARDKFGDLDVEADELVRLGRVRFDKRGAAFRVACPDEFTGLLARRGDNGQWHKGREGGQRDDSDEGSHAILLNIKEGTI
jgi:hypothetical protein